MMGVGGGYAVRFLGVPAFAAEPGFVSLRDKQPRACKYRKPTKCDSYEPHPSASVRA